MVGGLAAVPIVVPYPEWTVVPWLLVGAIGGVLAGRASRVAVAWLAALVSVPLILGVREVGLYGQLLVVGVPFAIALVAILASIGFIAGSVLVTRRQTLPLLREAWLATSRPWRWLLATSIAFVLIAVTAFLQLSCSAPTVRAAFGVEVASMPIAACPALGLDYESINYDQRDDATLQWRQKAAADGMLH